jgi:hypothetical protein
MSFQVFAQRLSTFFRRDLEISLSAGTDWAKLPWHINQKCSACEYLGVDVVDPSKDHEGYCHSEARRTDNLTRIPFLSQGSKRALQDAAVAPTSALATMPGASPVYDTHNSLRADRNIIASRASALAGASAVTPPGRRTSALPEWADLRIYLTVDFDPGSAITMRSGSWPSGWSFSPTAPGRPAGSSCPWSFPAAASTRRGKV